MVALFTLDDLERLKVQGSIKAVVLSVFIQVSTAYCTDNLKKVGGIYYVDSMNDIEIINGGFFLAGYSVENPEFLEKHYLPFGAVLYHALFVKGNDFAVDVFSVPQYLPERLMQIYDRFLS